MADGIGAMVLSACKFLSHLKADIIYFQDSGRLGFPEDFACCTRFLQACVVVPLALLFDEHCIILSLKLGLAHTHALPGTRGA